MKYFTNNNGDGTGNASQQAIKRTNIARVFELIKQGKNVSRATIAKETRLTPTTVSSLVDELIERGFVMQVGTGESATGRKPILLEVDPAGAQIPVLDFRAQGIAYALFDLRFQELENAYRPFPKALLDIGETRREEVIYRRIEGTDIVETAIEILQHNAKRIDWKKVRAVCITIPGTFLWEERSFTSSVLKIKTTTFFIEEIYRQLGQIPLLVGNASPSLAYAEKCARGGVMRDLIFVNVGSGVGVGKIVEGETPCGENGDTCEFGHMSIDLNGRECFCGNRGCIERYINNAAIIRRVIKEIEGGRPSMALELCGGALETLSLELLRAASEAGDEVVNDVLRYVAKCLAVGISNMVCSIGLHNVVLGGGIEKLGDNFLNYVQEQARVVGYRRRMDRVKITYTILKENADSLGIAQQFVDMYLASTF